MSDQLPSAENDALGDLELWAVLSYKDGDEHGWETEFAHLRETHSDRLAELRESILKDGIKSPVVIGPDGRIWDGHHRLCVADELGLSTVPVTFDTCVIPPGGGTDV